MNVFKDKAPGEVGIRKTFMQKKTPGSADRKPEGNLQLVPFEKIFPIKLKNAVMILVRKSRERPEESRELPTNILIRTSRILFEITDNRITSYIEQRNLFT